MPPPAQNCREELATLRLTLDTLSTLREEEIPRRIAFVSDQIFEPRWWQRYLESQLRRRMCHRRGHPGACLRAPSRATPKFKPRFKPASMSP